MTDFSQMQSVINGQATKLSDNPEALAEYMKDKPEHVKEAARSHLKTVKALKAKGK